MNILNPTYAISVNSANCQIEIRCNDVIVFEFKGKRTENKAGISMTIPINQFILRNGDFDIRGTILPAYGSDVLEETSSLKMKLSIFDSNSPIKTRIELLHLKTPQKNENEKPDDNNPVKNLNNLPRYELFSKFQAEKLPFNETGWMNSVDLSELPYQNLLMESYRFYQKIHSVINTNDVNSFIKLVEDRDEILKNTNYLNSIETKSLKQEIIRFMNDKELSLLPIPPINVLKMEFMGNSKLLRLIRQNDLPLLMFYNSLTKKSVKLNFKMHKKTATSELSII